MQPIAWLIAILKFKSDAVFWVKNHVRFPQFHNFALKVLSFPASSAPVERILMEGALK